MRGATESETICEALRKWGLARPDQEATIGEAVLHFGRAKPVIQARINDLYNTGWVANTGRAHEGADTTMQTVWKFLAEQLPPDEWPQKTDLLSPPRRPPAKPRETDLSTVKRVTADPAYANWRKRCRRNNERANATMRKMLDNWFRDHPEDCPGT